MDQLQPLALALTQRLDSDLPRSALPNAPVVPQVDTEPRFVRLRAGTAALLRRAADRVESAPSYS